MAQVLDRMIAADVIVMATPVYFYTMCAQMKTVIDRTVARYTKISDKDFYFIVTAADTSKPAMGSTMEGFRAFTSLLRGAKRKRYRLWHGRLGYWRNSDKPCHEAGI